MSLCSQVRIHAFDNTRMCFCQFGFEFHLLRKQVIRLILKLNYSESTSYPLEQQSTSSIGDESLQLRMTADLPDLEDLISSKRVIDVTVEDDIIGWLSQLCRSSREFEWVPLTRTCWQEP